MGHGMNLYETVVFNWGSTAEERGEVYPCDRLVPQADDVLFRAVDIDAAPAVTFRWLCQLRAAPYSYDWLDNLGRRSPRELTPGLDALAVGQPVMTIFKLAEFEPGSQITLVPRFGPTVGPLGGVAVTYRVSPASRGSRLVAKLAIKRPPGPLRLIAALLPAADLVMMRKQLLTLKGLAERDASRP